MFDINLDGLDELDELDGLDGLDGLDELDKVIVSCPIRPVSPNLLEVLSLLLRIDAFFFALITQISIEIAVIKANAAIRFKGDDFCSDCAD